MWIIATVNAVVLQSFRNAGAKRISGRYASLSVTLCRFLFGIPLSSALLILACLFFREIPRISLSFFPWALGMCLLQIGANLCLVLLFHHKKFALALGLTKSEIIFASLFGILLLGEFPSLLASLGIVICLVGLVLSLLSEAPKGQLQLHESQARHSPRTRTQSRLFTLLLALASGLGLALASIFLKRALPSIHASHPVLPILLSVFLILVMQSAILLPIVWKRHRRDLAAMAKDPALPVSVGVLSSLGTFFWYTAFSLSFVAYVRTLGQLEFIIGALMSPIYFKEKLRILDILSLFLTALGAILLAFA